jgi:hypothetical protein
MEKSKKRKIELGGNTMLSFEEWQKIGEQMREDKRKRDEMIQEVHEQYLRSRGIDPNASKAPKRQEEHPFTPSDGVGTFIYILALFGSCIFKQWLLWWIAITVFYAKFITRHDND